MPANDLERAIVEFVETVSCCVKVNRLDSNRSVSTVAVFYQDTNNDVGIFSAL